MPVSKYVEDSKMATMKAEILVGHKHAMCILNSQTIVMHQCIINFPHPKHLERYFDVAKNHHKCLMS